MSDVAEDQISAALLRHAKRISNGLQNETATQEHERRNLEAQIAALRAKLANIERQREAALLAPNRFRSFSPVLGAQYQCPACWIEYERRSNLVSRPTGNGSDALGCDTCGGDFIVRQDPRA